MGQPQRQSFEMPDDSRLPPEVLAYPLAARQLWAMIRHLERNRGWCYAGQNYLADTLGISRRTVIRYLARMLSEGLILKRFRRGAPSLMRVRVTSSCDKSSDRVVTGVGHSCHTQVCQPCPPNKNNTSKHLGDTPKDAPPDSPQNAPLFHPVEWSPWSISDAADPVLAFTEAFEARKVAQIKDEESWRVILKAGPLPSNPRYLTIKVAIDAAGGDGSCHRWITLHGSQIPLRKWRA